MSRRKRRSARVKSAADIAKEREKRRKKMLKTKYGQRTIKHARKGIQSCGYAGVCVFLLVLMVLFSFFRKGDVNLLMGFAAFFVLWIAVTGIRTGLRGMNERDRNYITCKIGIGINGMILLGLAALFIRGLL